MAHFIEEQYLRDESRSVGHAENISFARDEEEIRSVIAFVNRERMPLTIQGARTGLAGGAVPRGGYILNLSKMNRITGMRYDPAHDQFSLLVQPGVTLADVRKAIDTKEFDTNGWEKDSLAALALFMTRNRFVFTPDPTETSASLGGMVGCNASGARSFYHGATRSHIKSLRIVLMDGSTVLLRRGVDRVRNGCFSLQTLDGKGLSACLPQYRQPDVKNASGYYVKPDMDLLDLFVGAEGTLGVVSEIELLLRPAPNAAWGVTVFFPTEAASLLFVKALRGEGVDQSTHALPKPVSIEFFNSEALNLLRRQREGSSVFGQLLDIKAHYHTAIYVELHGDSDKELAQTVLAMGELVETSGGDEASTWIATNPRDMEKLLFFRHAIPESVNMLIDKRRRVDPRITKLGTDMAVPDSELVATMEMYNTRLKEENLEAVMFGHIGNNHIHVNILPRDYDDYVWGKALYLEWAREVVKKGGTVSAEHGIGKLKTAFLAEMYGWQAIAKMRAIKSIFDPQWLLSPGNMFEEVN